MKSDDATRSAHQSETAASSQEAQSAKKSKQELPADEEGFSPDEDARLRQSIGSDDWDFLYPAIRQLSGLFPCNGTSDEDAAKFPVSIIRGVKIEGSG